jgi:hypothetical protein
MMATLPVDRSLAAHETLDAERFAWGGTTTRSTGFHVDVDCLSRFFALAFPRDSTVAGPTMTLGASGMDHRPPLLP